MIRENYTGTAGLTPNMAINRVEELFKRYQLNTNEEKQLIESITLLKKQIPTLVENNKWWVAVEDHLTANIWKKTRKEILKEE